ncbi:hypothetical protein CANARDRAFT_27307 [[Candida] arabinofermentans NRRL YB-2248]|uniref:t-SNARE coiled-coil homology domain-containing protein n=1 Tax=[Candida] arabinofermentans NRRL YB-2248 TaxID=983967 RepID=A0A1E4T5E4_9ASCO|nr:hypothetical protein CANARDRAFT_27307 [[Candida] arabinofermentans NRRL YB-2248]
MSSSRYSSKVHQREGRTSLFTTTQQQALSASQSPTRSNQFYQQPISSANSQTSISSINHQQSRHIINDESSFIRSSSPYENSNTPKKDYNASLLSQLESQNDETVSIMGSKISALKNLSLKMGDEINKSKLNLNSFGGDMESTMNNVKGNFKRMIIMADKTGISWKIWLLFFGVIFFVFFWVWIF